MGDRSYTKVPRVAVGAVIFQGDQILLVKRRSEPKASNWTIPGGVVELGETVEACVRREIQEECGLIIELVRLVDVIDYIEKDTLNRIKYHYVIIDYEARVVGGSLNADSDAVEARWFDNNELPNLNLPEITRTFLDRHYFD